MTSPQEPGYAEIVALVNAQAAAREATERRLLGVLRRVWRAFRGHYNDDAVAEFARQTGGLVATGQRQTATQTASFVHRATSILTEEPLRPRGTTLVLPDPAEMRNLPTVEELYERPVKDFRYQRSLGATIEEALDAGEKRLERIVDLDLAMADREGAKQALEDETRVFHYRRIIHPELSKGGVCGLCIAASDRVYKKADLLPIHANCKCTVLPIVGGKDPGRSLNGEDLKKLYEEAGGTDAAKLKRTRYKVEEHGELGPVLVKQDDKFTDKRGAQDRAGQGREQPIDLDRVQGQTGPGGPPVKPPSDSRAASASDEPGRVDRSQVENLEQHELDTAERLARRGHDVVFIPPDPGQRTPDVTIDGEQWELKSPTGSSPDTIVRNIRKARAQSPRVVIDLSRSSLDRDEAKRSAQQALRRYSGIEQIRLIDDSEYDEIVTGD